jgi:hypothetical protein
MSNNFEIFQKLTKNKLCCLLLIEKVLKPKLSLNVKSLTNLTIYFLTL